MEHSLAEKFCEHWLVSWSGGKESVEKLLKNYAENAFYSDPANPKGIESHQQLKNYFSKLLEKIQIGFGK